MSRFGRFYAKVSVRMEEQGVGEHRRHALAGLHGWVIEVGCGNGLNFRHYPPEVTHVVAVEPDEYLRAIALANAANAAVPIDVVDGDADHLPGEGYDAAVATLVLCTVPHPDHALAEMARVLKSGGELRFYEHVLAPTRGMQRVQRFMDATFWPRVAGGCHAGRDTAAAIDAAGFDIVELEPIRFPDNRLPMPVKSHIIGTAVRR